MSWISVKEFAALRGVSERAVQKGISKGKHQVKEVPHPSRKDQVAYLIWTGEPSDELANWRTTGELANQQTGEPSDELTNWRTTGELANQQTDEPCEPALGDSCFRRNEGGADHIADVSNMVEHPHPQPLSPEGRGEQNDDPVDERSSRGVFTAESAGSNPARVTNEGREVEKSRGREVEGLGGREDGATTVLDLRPRIKEVPLKYKELVDAKVQIVSQAIASHDLETFHQGLSHGLICETAMGTIGKEVSLRTLYRWVAEYRKDGALALCPGYSIESGRGRKVPEDVQNKLLKILLSPNKVAVSTAVNIIQDHYRNQHKPLDCSYRTMLRWVEDWKQKNLQQWTIAREGMKAYRERINRTILRDWTLTNVGDAWISDGHTIEVMLIDPKDGKAKKFEVVAWLDAASRMPVGASINLTENTEAISISFRNAVLNELTGYKPLCVYVDNGKAYKSKYFSGSKKSPEDIEVEIEGVFARLGITVINSQPYNAKAKIIERWWLSLQEQMERLTSGWTGANASAKPANLNRDEKFVKAKWEHKALTIDEFKRIFEYWSINIYGQQTHPDYKDKTRLQVLVEGREAIPADRFISPYQLNYMLLVIDRKRISNQGVTINKVIYWHEDLVGYVGRDLIVRWDYWDITSILVYDEKDRFICQAVMRRYQNPLVKLKGDSVSKRELEAELKQIRSIERKDKENLAETLKRVEGATDDMMQMLPASEINLLNNTPMLPELPKRVETIEEKLMNDGASASAGTEELSDSEKADRRLKEEFERLGLR